MFSNLRRKEDRRNSASVVELRRAAKLAQSRLADCEKSLGLRRTNSYKGNENGEEKSPAYLRPPYPDYYEPELRHLSASSSDNDLRLHRKRHSLTPKGSPNYSPTRTRRGQSKGFSSLNIPINGHHLSEQSRSVKDLRNCDAYGSNEDTLQHGDKKRRGSWAVSSPRLLSLTGIPEDIKTLKAKETDSLCTDTSSLPGYHSCDYFFKIMMVGDSGVGKTCLVTKFRDGVFLSGSFIATVGIDHRNRTIRLGGKSVRMQLWDSAGQDRFRKFVRSHYKDVHAVMLVYDVRNRRSFSSIRGYVQDIRKTLGGDTIILLVGHKSDLGEQDRCVAKTEGVYLSKDLGINFLEASSKTGENVDLAFRSLAMKLKAQTNPQDKDANFSLQEYIDKNESFWLSSCCPACNIS